MRTLFAVLILSVCAFAQGLGGNAGMGGTAGAGGGTTVVAGPTVVQSTQSTANCTGTTCVTAAFTNPVVIGHSIVCGMVNDAGAGIITNVTDNASGGSNTYTVRGSACRNGSGGTDIQFVDAMSITHGGSPAVTVTLGSSSTFGTLKCMEVTATTFDKVSACATGTSTAITGASVTPTSANSLAVAMGRMEAVGVMTPNAPYTDVLNDGGGNGTDISSNVISAGSSPVWTIPSNIWATLTWVGI